jgi:hypothetical protein
MLQGIRLDTIYSAADMHNRQAISHHARDGSHRYLKLPRDVCKGQMTHAISSGVRNTYFSNAARRFSIETISSSSSRDSWIM